VTQDRLLRFLAWRAGRRAVMEATEWFVTAVWALIARTVVTKGARVRPAPEGEDGRGARAARNEPASAERPGSTPGGASYSMAEREARGGNASLSPRVRNTRTPWSVPGLRYTTDYEAKTVTARVSPLKKWTGVFREGLGA